MNQKKKIKQEKRKAKKNKSMVQKRAPNNTLQKELKQKGKRTIRTFEGDFPLLVCSFARTRLPMNQAEKAR